MNLVTTYYTSDGQELRPGVRVAHARHLQPISFTVDAVCESVEPVIWFGDVRFAGQFILRTEAVESEEKASHQAEQVLIAKIVSLFSE